MERSKNESEHSIFLYVFISADSETGLGDTNGCAAMIGEDIERVAHTVDTIIVVIPALSKEAESSDIEIGNALEEKQ